jgi:phosphonoacetaldehyde hydrolase
MAGIRLVVFDWAGTTVDHGCFAPVAAFVAAFARHGVTVSTAEARGPMGLHKKDHIRTMLQAPALAQRWRSAHGRDWTESDVDAVFRGFVPLQLEVIDNHSRLVPGLLDCVAQLRALGVKVGATTGYFQEAAQRVYAAARAQSYEPDICLCAEDVPGGRPAPWMIFRIMERLGLYPPAAVVKLGDTVHDIAEGLNAGVWSVGVTATGSEVGCTEEEFAALPEATRREKCEAARRLLVSAGAHEVIGSVAELPALLRKIGERLAAGDVPGVLLPSRRPPG